MIIIVDNYDSFTYNLFQYVKEYYPDVRVIKNDDINGAFDDELKNSIEYVELDSIDSVQLNKENEIIDFLSASGVCA